MFFHTEPATTNVDTNRKISFHRAARMHHLGIGATHRSKKVLILATETTITVIETTTGEILSEHTIEPTKTYWRNQQKKPGRWPS